MLIKVQKRSSWAEFRNVIQALLIREVKTRFGKYNLGFLWLLLEPLTSVLIIGVILAPFRSNGNEDIPYAFFLLCGFLILKTLTGPMMSGMNAISANQGLLIFRQVEPIDTFIARFIFEILTSLFSFTTFCLVGAWIGIPLSGSHLFEALYCFLTIWLMGSGLGIYLGIQAMKFKELEKVLGFITRPLLFISCVLYPLSVVPFEYQKFFLYNPLVHAIEYLRQSLFPVTYKVEQVNLIYPSLCALVSLSFGLVTYRNNRHYLKQR